MSTVFPSSMPFDNITIIDQSSYVEETVVETPYIPDGPVAFIPFISPRGYGEDNKLQYMTASKLAKYGDPNLKKYGLSLYLARRFAEGGGTVLGMRVTTDKHSHANFVVTANVSTDNIVAKYVGITNSINGVTTSYPIFKDAAGTEYYFDTIAIADPASINSICKPEGDVLSTGSEVSINVNGSIQEGTFTNDGATATITTSVDGGDVVYTLVTGTGVSVKYTVDSITEAQSIDYIKNEADKKFVDGTTYPLFVVASKGAGKYGNAFKARLTVDTAMNSYNETAGGSGFFYKFIDSDNNGSLDNPMSFTFNDDYMYQNESMCIEEVFNKYTENVTMIKLNSFDKFIAFIEKKCCDPYNPVHTVKDINNVDILFGSNMDSTVYYVDTVSTDAVNLSISTGIPFLNGAEETKPFSFEKDPYADALASAYNGEISDLIYDHVRYPFQSLFCPSFDSAVMDAIHNLSVVNRKCTMAYYFVLGTNGSMVPATYEEARSVRNLIPANSWKEVIVPEWARVVDPFTGRKTFMPSVYFLAYTVPNHWNRRKGKPLAGRLNAIWTGFDVGTVTPASSNDAEYVLNHNAGYNTMIEDGIGNAELYEQITAQTNTSRLSEINNCQVLCEMVKIALKKAKENRWNDLGDEDISTYKSIVEGEISTSLKDCYKTMEVVATRESSNGAGRNRILCKINVLFKDMFKGVSYEFYILAQ